MKHLLANTNIKAAPFPPSRLDLMRESYPDRPETGPALSRILLSQIAAGSRPATVRLTRPGRMVAFGRRDTLSPGYPDAVEAARKAGFDGIERLTGGRVAAPIAQRVLRTALNPAPASGDLPGQLGGG